MRIPFNKPHKTGKEFEYIKQAIDLGKISGNGDFTKRCQEFFEDRFGFGKCLLTSSCTDALEMSSILIDIEPGDEVIMPSYTFVSTANAFVLRGAKIVFVDSREDHPGMDEDKIEALVTDKTKAIVPVHYAGVACDMDKIMDLAKKYNLFVIEDAAQAIDSYYTGRDGVRRALGSIGHFATFSFHETKNIISGEGGMLVVNDKSFEGRAEIIWEKGTNRSAFFRGEIDKYGWVDIGSSFLPSEITAAYLYAQLENLDEIQSFRRNLWESYNELIEQIAPNARKPIIPSYATNNGHMYYLVFNTGEERNEFLSRMKGLGVHCVFHYLSLHKSPFYREKYDGGELKVSDHYTEGLVRMPFYYGLTIEDLDVFKA